MSIKKKAMAPKKSPVELQERNLLSLRYKPELNHTAWDLFDK